jgi:hypothetical protein
VRSGRIVGCAAVCLVVLAPAVPGIARATSVRLDEGGAALESVACPSARQCTAVAHAQEWTFDPRVSRRPQPTAVDSPPGGAEGLSESAGSIQVSVVCPSTHQCAVVDSNGREVTFDPRSPGHPQPITIDSGNTGEPNENELSFGQMPLACPSVQQCTAVDYEGHEVTFDPRTPGTPARVSVDSGARLRLLACPSSEQCTAADTTGHVVTFDPRSPGTSAPVTISAHQLTGLACPATDLCVAFDELGHVLMFDPRSSRPDVRSPIKGSGAPR